MAEPLTYATSFFIKILSFIFGILIKKPVELIGKFLYLEAYKVSTAYNSYLEINRIFSHSLGEIVDYDINWSEVYLNKKQPNCTLRIKAKNNQYFHKITFCITASLDNLKYQSVVDIYDVSDMPCVVALPSIPLRNIEVKNDRLYEPYSRVKIEIKELFDKEGNAIDFNWDLKNTVYPIDNLDRFFTKKESDVYKWGQWWSLDFLESEKDEIPRLCHAYAFNARFKRSRKVYFWQAVAWLVDIRFILNICFWSRNIIRAKQLKKALDRFLKEYY